MMVKALSCWAALAALACAAGCGSSPCALPAATELWSDGPPHEPGGKRLARFDLDDDALWWSATLPRSPRLAAFRRAVRALLPDVGQPALTAIALAHEPDAATRQNLLVAAELAPTTQGPMRCIEAAIFDDQMARLDMAAHPSEVLAFILRGPPGGSASGSASGAGARLRVYTFTVNAAGIGNVGRVRPYVEADVGAGWRLDAVFHDHNFFLDRSGAMPGQVDLGVGGVVAPSAPDADILRSFRDDLGMRAAWIANGFVTARWEAALLDRFAGPPPAP